LHGAGTARAAVVTTVLVVLLAVAAVLLLPPVAAGGALIGLTALFLTRRLVFSRPGAIVTLVTVVMFVPVRRYMLPVPLPFALEPYRIVIVVLLFVVVAGLLIDPVGMKWRPIRFGWPIGIFFATLYLSIVVNVWNLLEEGLLGGALGGLVNLMLLMSVAYMVRQLIRDERDLLRLLSLLVWCGAAVGFFAVVERITSTNVFLQLHTFLPLVLMGDREEIWRQGGARSFGSAQHPIALAILMCILLPIAVYLAGHGTRPANPVNRRIAYGIAAMWLLLGIAASISRTAVIVIAVVYLATAILLPRVGRLLALIAAPFLLVGTLLAPGVFLSMIGSFLDPEELIASQYASAGWTGSGRLADLGPAMQEVAARPFFGSGFGSRIVVGEDRNAFILDNQVLSTLVESGAVGAVGLALLMIVPIWILVAYAFRSGTEKRWSHLAFALALSVTGYTVALFFYDAFGFMQPFLVLAMLLAAGAWVTTERTARPSSDDEASPAMEAVP
jgi:hypothetical protein